MQEKHCEIAYSEDPALVDWAKLKEDLASDEFDNGRTAGELEQSFAVSQFAVFACSGNEVVGTARLLADGVCNAYLIDVWTKSSWRRRGIGREMVSRLLQKVPGHHVGLFTDSATNFYEGLGFQREEVGMSRIVGEWLNPRRPSPDV
ncbi:MAG: GNAT family N-acetyltransferase [Actinobacteria bacterium]|nr:GNAT family N-acetyltransferase [Actinomycetota bacterium]